MSQGAVRWRVGLADFTGIRSCAICVRDGQEDEISLKLWLIFAFAIIAFGVTGLA
jgi:hypothetical protein